MHVYSYSCVDGTGLIIFTLNKFHSNTLQEVQSILHFSRRSENSESFL